MVAALFFFPLQEDIHKPEEELFEVCSGTSAHSLCITLPTQSDRSTVFPLQPSADESCISWMWWIPQPCTLDPLKGNEQRPGALQGPWEFWAPQQPGSSLGSWKQSSVLHVIWLWHITDLFLTHKLRWQQKSGEGMNKCEKIFNLTFTVNYFRDKNLRPRWNFIQIIKTAKGVQINYARIWTMGINLC